MELIEISSVDELPDAAETLLSRLDGRNVVAFYGEMGAGKTTFIKEIVLALGSADNVTSPTFALVNRYLSGKGEDIFHFDFYRLDKPSEALDMGCEEYFSGGDLCLVEWPEKIGELLPPDAVRVEISTVPEDEQSRVIKII